MIIFLRLTKLYRKLFMENRRDFLQRAYGHVIVVFLYLGNSLPGDAKFLRQLLPG